MSAPAISDASARVVRDYLRAKDGQLPLLFSRVFSPHGRFVATYDFPAPFEDAGPREGLDAVTELFRKMGERCENIVTVVPVETARESESTLQTQWVVAMTTRSGQGGFVGWGTYRWTFESDGQRARELAVRFEGMAPLSVAEAPALLGDFMDLPHPWCTGAEISEASSSMRSLGPLRMWLDAPMRGAGCSSAA